MRHDKVARPMSGLGQKPTKFDVCFMSAFPLIATKSRTSQHVGDGPQADSCTAANDLSGL
jgi:hypothetical protein